MIGLSDVSDVNPDDMAKMVGDLDDLDNDLFGTSLKKQNHQTKTEVTKPATGIGKQVVFHDFNEDDPLADLLSDDDDFAELPRSGSAKGKSNLMSDLFGIKNIKPPETNVKHPTEEVKPAVPVEKSSNAKPKPVSRKENLLGLTDDLPIILQEEKPRPKTAPRAKSIFDNNHDIAANLAEKSNPLGEKGKKSSLMEDLFGNRPNSNPTKDAYPRRESEKLGLEIPAMEKKSETPYKTGGLAYAPSGSVPREARRGRRNSGVIVDPLGMFTTTPAQIETSTSQAPEVNPQRSDFVPLSKSIDPISETRRSLETQKNDLPEWLGGPKKTKDDKPHNEEDIVSLRTKSSDLPSNTAVTVPNVLVPNDNKTIENPGSLRETSLEYQIGNPEHVSLLIGTQFDQQSAIMSLQQQEHELRTAAALSRQSEQMSQLLEKQRSKLNEQEMQFNMLIKRQIDRQALLEAQMKAQQDRINNHIQVLMSQPSSVPLVTTTYTADRISNKIADEHISEETKSECYIQNLQQEKLYLENTLDNLREKHDREIATIEESYKKQISILQEGMGKIERRIRQDAELTEADYETRIQKLRDDQTSLRLIHAEEMEELRKEHNRQVQEIRNQQHRNIELLQKEHAETIENIAEAKKLERLAINDTKIHSTNLADMIQTAQVVMTSMQDLEKKFLEKNDKLEQSREISLRQQEEDLQVLKEQLERQRDNLEMERKRLTEATERLDTGTLKLVSESEKRSGVHAEAEERIQMRERALIKDRELFNAQIQWERSHIQAMKETWMKEQERQTKQLAEERDAVAGEKAKLEILNRLKIGADETAKAELEAAVKAARDAASDANNERQKWRERLNEIELERQKIRDREGQLTSRAKELENLTQSALEKREEGLQALREAHHLQEQHKQHLAQLQMQLENLAQRENKLANEKVALARERLALRVNRADKPEKDQAKPGAPHSYTDHNFQNLSQIPSSLHTVTHFKDIVDPHLVLLKLDLDKELDTSNECLAAMSIVSQ